MAASILFESVQALLVCVYVILDTLCMDIQVPKPKLEMVVPYKEYKLVHSDGSIPERTKKHPFCMSRVHYSEIGEMGSLPSVTAGS